MATTTNYSWTTPDDTALVKDGASAIRSLGSSIDTTTKNLNPSTTLGDIEYRSATANTNTRLAIGSDGTILKVASGVPSWAADIGKVVGAVQTVTRETSSSTSYTALTTATSVTATTGTKALVLFGCTHESSAGQGRYASIAVSGASTIAASDNNGVFLDGAVTGSFFGAIYFTTLTAGSNTFAMQFRVTAGTGGFQRRTITVIDLGS